MRTRVRMWWVVKWGGLLMTLLIFAVCVLSGWWSLEAHTGGGSTLQICCGGSVGLSVWDPEPIVFALGVPQIDPRGLTLSQTGWMGFDIGYRVNTGPWGPTYTISLLPIAACFGGATAIAWFLDARARRRARLNQCVRCGYDRAGLAEGAACPECGGKQ